MFAGGDTVPSISFKDAPIGASVTGVVTVAPSLVQSRDFKTGQPAFWPDNNPKMSVVTRILASGEERGLWAAKPSAMFAAIAEAQKAAGALIAVGGTLTITLTGTKPSDNAQMSPQKLYAVAYVPPNAFEAQQAPATGGVGQWGAQSTTPPPPVWAAPAAAPPAAQAWQQPAAAQPLAVVPNPAPAVPQTPAVPQWTPEQIAAAQAAGIPLPGVTS